ncbi:MAG TPA: NAD-binding protein [Anaerolineaceae bacterium]|nr:NAD-binding protein [Anaerolineaceae bacterium]HQH86722.1 NAD-binding protein [Anaerolineaceae bacterium]
MPEKIPFRERFQYWLDNQFSRGTGALILWLGILSLAVIVVAGGIIALLGIAPAGSERLSFLEAAWQSLMRTLDAGTMGGDEGLGFRIIMFLVTLGGIFVISTLIGVLTSAVEGKLEDLRKGRSRVLETNQIVILGWSEQIFTIITELIAANENVEKPCIVILGKKDKVEMEDEIASKVEDRKNMRIICRSGDPMDVADLNLVSLNQARAIVVLSPEGNDPDSEVIKAVLAVVNHPNRDPEKTFHIVAEIYEPENMDAALVVGRGQVEWVLVGDFVARVVAQTCRQSGLSVVYTELLDFGGDEIYIKPEPRLTGKTFGEALLAYRTNTVLGIRKPNTMPCLNAPMDQVIEAGDELIVIAEDDDKIFLTLDQPVQIQEAQIVSGHIAPKQSEATLLLGWNRRGATIIRELDNYVAPGSEVTIVADVDTVGTDLEICCSELTNQKITFQQADTTNRRVLEGLNLRRFNHIILLCYSDTMDVQRADAHTLVTLLHLRDIADRDGTKFTIVSEMLDIRNRNLADVTRADDFIVSDKLVSLMMAQITENKYLNGVFTDMFDPEGSEIYLKPAAEYIQLGKPVNFYTIVETARRRNQVAIGYRLQANSQDAAHGYGVKINPDKAEMVTFTDHDRIVVISEE